MIWQIASFDVKLVDRLATRDSVFLLKKYAKKKSGDEADELVCVSSEATKDYKMRMFKLRKASESSQ